MGNKTNLGKPITIQIPISRTQLIVIFISSFLFYLVALILWKQKMVDYDIVIIHNFIYENKTYLGLFRWISHYGMAFITALYALLLFMSSKKEELKHERSLYFLILFSFVLGTIGGDLLKAVINKARPVIELSGQIGHTTLSDTSSFPSGHATKSMSLALPFVLMASRKSTITQIVKVLVFLTALLVCYSRIAQQVHFLSDVLAGIGTALFFIPIAAWITNYIYRKRKIDDAKLTLLTQKLVYLFIGLTVILYFV